jgi:hypothetical protein
LSSGTRASDPGYSPGGAADAPNLSRYAEIIMKTITYVAAVALLTVGTAFAQSSGMNSPSSTQNKPAQSQDQITSGSSQNESSMSNQGMSGSGSSPSSSTTNRDMDRSSKADMDNGKAAKQAQSSTQRRHVASRARMSGNDARENQETAQLNRQQAGGMGASSMSGGSGGQTAENPFDRGSPQYPQAGGAACTPDRPDCGTARQNPAIQSSPQQRMYNASPQ